MFDRKLWKEKFDELPSWPCPRCGAGRIAVVNDTLKITETELYKRARQEEAWEPEWNENRFTAYLQCNDPSCGEGAVIVGTSRWDLHQYYDHQGHTQSEVNDVFYPQAIHPPPPVIHVSEETPEEIADEISRASALIWMDPASSANRLRVAAERTLTAKGVKRYRMVGGKRKPIMLHDRIGLLPAKDAAIADCLHSIRFIGNYASHQAELDVARQDLLSAFEIMEHVLELAFSTKSKQIAKKVKDISRRKGRPQSSRKKNFLRLSKPESD